MNPTDLELQFINEMKMICQKAKEELGYNPSRFLQMISENGAIETAKTLINKDGLSTGFVFLIERGRADLTMENSVLKEKYKSLFTDAERDICRGRLGLLEK